MSLSGPSREHRHERRARSRARRAARGFLRPVPYAAGAYLAAILVLPALVPPPPGVGLAGPPREAGALRYLVDDSWLDASGERHLEQSIFDEVFAMIGRAERLVLLDMFLFNDWQGPAPERHRALADELAAALIRRRAERPTLEVVLITDPINTVYGGLASGRLDALADAGVTTVLTDLVPLQDSNRLWSGLWRWLVRPFGNAPGETLPNPLGPGRVTLRSWLALANFKANHRKLVVADDGTGELVALITSANPHDGSSAHRNTALAFDGAAVGDLVAAERALLAQSGADAALARLDAALADLAAAPPGEARARVGRTPTPPRSDGALTTVQVLGERRIEEAALTMLARAGEGARVDLSMFYLADRDLVAALVAAAARGARVRALLDVNRDAFGRAKNGVPNRAVAAELVRAGVAVRWCEGAGEQCHAKQLYVDGGEEGEEEGGGAAALLLGSANYTRRNLHDLNLETDVRVELAPDAPLAVEVRDHFDRLWDNAGGRTYSSAYATHADESPWLTLQYRLMEASGLSTF